MNKVIFTILVFLTLINFSYSQDSSFYDGFETGDFSKWNDHVGAVISNTYKHSGNYSAKFETGGNEMKIVKNNSSNNYVRIEFYVYITYWGSPLSSGYLHIGGNGWVWFWQLYNVNYSYFYNCNHVKMGTYTQYCPMNYWNHIILEKRSTGYVYAWINGAQYLDGLNVGTCSISDITLGKSMYITLYIDDVNINYTTDIKPISSEIPSKYFMFQNYPNPFNPVTYIKFDIPENEFVTIKVFDMLGHEVKILVNEKLNAGSYKVDWNASEYPSGVYFYRLQTDNYTEVKKMTLIK